MQMFSRLGQTRRKMLLQQEVRNTFEKKIKKNTVIFSSRKDQCEDPYSGDICNNNGDCECNSCQCHSGFDGKFCQINKDDDQDEETCEILKPCILHDLYGQDKNVDDDFKV